MLHTRASRFLFGVALLLGTRQLDAQTQPETVVWPASGIRFDDTLPERLVVRQVAPDSRAAAASLRPGDTVLTMDQRSFSTPAEVEAYLAGRGAQPVCFMVLRDAERLPVVYAGDFVDWNAHRVPQPKYGQVDGIGIRVAGARPVVIVAAYHGSPADRAGILPGDQLLAVNGVAYLQVAAVSAAIAQHPAGDEVRLTVRRDGVDEVITVTPEAWGLAFDESAHVLRGWEYRCRRCGCRSCTDDFAFHDDARWESASDAITDELTVLRHEIRELRQELSQTNSRLDALQSRLAEEE